MRCITNKTNSYKAQQNRFVSRSLFACWFSHFTFQFVVDVCETRSCLLYPFFYSYSLWHCVTINLELHSDYCQTSSLLSIVDWQTASLREKGKKSKNFFCVFFVNFVIKWSKENSRHGWNNREAIISSEKWHSSDWHKQQLVEHAC